MDSNTINLTPLSSYTTYDQKVWLKIHLSKQPFLRRPGQKYLKNELGDVSQGLGLDASTLPTLVSFIWEMWRLIGNKFHQMASCLFFSLPDS